MERNDVMVMTLDQLNELICKEALICVGTTDPGKDACSIYDCLLGFWFVVAADTDGL